MNFLEVLGSVAKAHKQLLLPAQLLTPTHSLSPSSWFSLGMRCHLGGLLISELKSS